MDPADILIPLQDMDKDEPLCGPPIAPRLTDDSCQPICLATHEQYQPEHSLSDTEQTVPQLCAPLSPMTMESSLLTPRTTESSGGYTLTDLSSPPDSHIIAEPITKLPIVVTETLSKRYYKGLPSQPALIATTKPGPFTDPTGPEAYSVLKEVRSLGNHPLALVWDNRLAQELFQALNDMGVKWTCLDAIRIANVGEPTGPAIVWIGVAIGALTFVDGRNVAIKCNALIRNHGIRDCYVEIRESRVLRQAGNRFLNPVLWANPTFTVRDPYTATLSIPIAAKNRDIAEGTGGFYLSAGRNDKNIYLVTARHVVLPVSKNENQEYFCQKHSQPREDVLILGTSTFNKKLADIDYKIADQESQIIQAQERIADAMDSSDPESVAALEVAVNDKNVAEESLPPLKALRNEICIYWMQKEKRVLGELYWAPPITFSTEPGHYTLDLAIIKIDDGMLDSQNYCGNTLNIGTKYSRQEFTNKVNLHHTNPTSFQFPPSLLLKLNDQVPEIDLIKPPMLDFNNHPCLIVFKSGATTGITIGRANNVCSFTNNYSLGMSYESREWPVIPSDEASAPFSKNGDSGSCVVDAYSRFGGILTGGSGATDSADVTYITPISYIMKVLHNTNQFKHAHLNPALA